MYSINNNNSSFFSPRSYPRARLSVQNIECQVCQKTMLIAEYILKNRSCTYNLCSFPCLSRQVTIIENELEESAIISCSEDDEKKSEEFLSEESN